MNISGKTKLCIIIGDPIEHTLSPAMHNAAYEHLHIDDAFVYIAAHAKVQDIKKVVEAVRVMNIRGLTCTVPHKVEVTQYLDYIHPVAQAIGAVNTVVNDNGVLKGYNTDWLGAVIPLEQRTHLENKRVALLGAGGAARAIAFGLLQKKAQVTIFNRTVETAQKLAQEFNCSSDSIANHTAIHDADIIINATSIGMIPHSDESPVPKKSIHKNHIVFDIVYSPHVTRLLRDAKEQHAKVMYGIEMLLHQGTAQFELYTNRNAPIEIMKKTLLDQLHINIDR